MLVLSRKKWQEIVIGRGTIIVKVLEIESNQVKIGIEAPEGVSVHRREIYELLVEEAGSPEIEDKDLTDPENNVLLPKKPS